MITLALDFQSPSIVRTCHSVGTTRSRETGIDSNGRDKIAKIVKNPLGVVSTQKSPLAVVLFSGDIVLSSTAKSFLILVQK